MLKKLAVSLVVAMAFMCLCLPQDAVASPAIYESAKPLTVSADGAYVPTDVDPYIERGRTLMPLRPGATAIGAEVKWYSKQKIAVITKDRNKLTFVLNEKAFYKNGKKRALDVPLQAKSGRIMLPLRAFAEALDVDVGWDAGTATVSVRTGGPMLTPPPKAQLPEEIYWLVDKYYTTEKNDGIVGSWWTEYIHENLTYDEGYVDPNFENALYHECIFIYKVAGKYKGILIFHADDNWHDPNSEKSTTVSELKPSNFGKNIIPSGDLGNIFLLEWPPLYVKSPAMGIEGDTYINLKPVDENLMSHTHTLAFYGDDLEVITPDAYYRRF